jgi:PAS domain S-box-containing protein
MRTSPLGGDRRAAGPGIDAELLDRLYSQVHLAVVVYDPQLRIPRVNAALERISGMPADRLVGRYVRDAYPELDTDIVEARLRAVLDGGKTVRTTEHRVRTRADPEREQV